MIRALFAAAVAGLLAAPAVAQDDKLKVKEGDKFPDVAVKVVQIEKALPDKKDAKEVKISDLKGKIVVVFFYPKAMTRGCTVESCGFRDAVKDYPKDVVVVGASADDTKLNQEFIDKEKLPYALMCDTDLSLIKALGVKMAKNDMAQRVTFIVDGEGTIRKIYTVQKIQEHPAEVLAFVKTLEKK
jgi:thioredoxin-dependent peroxiredoxin